MSMPAASPTTTAIAARAVDASKVYGQGEAEVRALDHISAEFATNQFTAIMGPSGSGKSTLLHCLAGLDRVTSGQVFIGDVDISAASEKQLTLIRRDRIGFVFQSFNLIPTLDGRENITLPMSLAGRKPDPAWFDQIVATLRLGDRLSHRPSELSGGQQQRVAIARAIVTEPMLLVADEPTGNLDTARTHEIMELLTKLNTELGLTIVMVTHEADVAGYAERTIRFLDGRVASDSKTLEMAQQ
jgi:putative ABC transport system ATP-binding protein